MVHQPVGFGSGDQVFGVTSGSGDPSGGLYGAGRFGYSINDFKVLSYMDLITKELVHGKMVDFEPDFLSSSLSNLKLMIQYHLTLQS